MLVVLLQQKLSRECSGKKPKPYDISYEMVTYVLEGYVCYAALIGEHIYNLTAFQQNSNSTVIHSEWIA